MVDPATAIKEKCAESHCTALKAKLDECNDRVQSKNKTTETCFEEILDFYHCVDHCAASDIFKVLFSLTFVAFISREYCKINVNIVSIFQHVK